MNLLNMNYYQGRQESRMFILQNFIMYLDTSNSSTLVCTIFSSFKYANILTYACSEKMCTSSTGFIYLNNLSLRLQLMNYYQGRQESRMFILQNFIMYLDTSNSSTLVCTIFSSFKYANILTYACSKKMCTSSTGFIYLNNLSL